MARIRSIKPEFWQDEKLARLPLGARLLFIGLWNIADDVGRLRGNPLFVRSQVFPYEPKADVEGWLGELHAIGVIQRYEKAGESFISVTNFLKHQQISKPSPSRLPAPEDSGSIPVGLPEPSGETPAGKEQGKEQGKERSREQGAGSRDAPQLQLTSPVPVWRPEVPVLFAYWAQRLNHPRAILDDNRRTLLLERFREGMTLEEGKLVIDGALVDIQAWPDRKKFDGIEYLFRDRSWVEKLSAMAGTVPTRPKGGYDVASQNHEPPPPGQYRREILK